MRPFGCYVTILNTLDSLGKFEGKVDEGFLVGYSISSKAFRVFNSRTRIVQVTLHVNFLENKPNVTGSGPTWLFDIDSLTRTMNYQPGTAGNQTNPSAGFQDKFDAEKAGEEIDQQYVLFLVWSSGSTNSQNNNGNAAFDGKEHDFDAKEPEFEVNVSPSSSAHAAGPSNAAASPTYGKSSFIDASQLPDDPDTPELEDITHSNNEDDVGVEADFINLETSITEEPKRVHQALKDPSLIEAMQEELLQFKMQKVWVLVDLPHGKRAIGTKRIFRNKKDERGIVITNKARLVAQGHTQEEGIDYVRNKKITTLILIFCPKVEMSRDVLTVGSTMRIPLLYRGEYSQWVERFMNYLEEQTDGEAMINSIKNGDQLLPRVTQVSIAETSSTEQPPLKDKSMWSDQEKRVQKIDRLARSLLIQGLPNDIYSLIDSNRFEKDLWDALARHMLGSKYGEQARKAVVLSKEKVVVSLDSERSETDDFNELKKITALLEKAFNRRKFYSKPTNNKLRTSSTSQKDILPKTAKKAKVKDYEYHKTKMLLAKKDKDEQVLLAEDQAWMESNK
nr:putative ribonuclease H-like domain-containing protein [Tanacetum cinerariifolium]